MLGPNGGGKTTFIKAITKLIKPSLGSVFCNTKNIGYLPQNFLISKNFPATVFEIIYSGFIKQRLIPNKQQLKIIDKLLNDMKIVHLRKKLISELSGGELQRVLFARAIVNSPSLLILDEPSSALDPLFRKFFYSYVEKLNKENNITIIMITHDLSSVNSVECVDRVIYIDRSIKFDGRFCDYYDKYLKEAKHVHIS